MAVLKSQLAEVVTDGHDRLMQPAGGAGVQRPVVHPELARALVDQVPPQPLQEPEDAGDVVGMPRAVAIQGPIAISYSRRVSAL
jgi:hypothetical protein